VRASGNKLQLPARHGQNDRAIALGRKNYLFAGSDAGGERAAALYSKAYLCDVLSRIADHPINRIGDLLPWNIGEPEQHRAAA